MLTAVVVGLAIVVALLAVLVVGLLRSNADVLRTLHDLGVREEELRGSGPRARARPELRTTDGVPGPRGLDAGVAVHDIAGATPDGGAARVGIEGSSELTLLAFLSSGCTTCHGFWSALRHPDVEVVPGHPGTRVVIVTRGPEDESPPAVLELAPPGLVTVMSSEAWDDYEVPVSPYFMLVDGTRGVLGEGASATWTQLVGLLEKAVADGGIVLEPGEQPISRRELLSRRAQRADRALLDAGIDPADPDAGTGPAATPAPAGEEGA